MKTRISCYSTVVAVSFAFCALIPAGCSRNSFSEIPSTVSSETTMRIAGKNQGLEVHSFRMAGGSRDRVALEFQRSMEVSLHSGTRTELMDSYLKTIRTLITNGGAKVSGNEPTDSPKGSLDFSLDYDAGPNRGIVRVETRSLGGDDPEMLGTNASAQHFVVTISCYEHRR